MEAAPYDASTAQQSASRSWAGPASVAGLWLLDTLLHVARQMVSPDATGSYLVSSVLYLSAGPVFAAVLASAIARRADRLLSIAAALLVIDCIVALSSAAVFEIWPSASSRADLRPRTCFVKRRAPRVS